MAWRRAHIGPSNDDAKVAWLRVWDHEWRSTNASVLLPPDAARPERYEIFEILTPLPVRFAAREISASVWSFWVED